MRLVRADNLEFDPSILTLLPFPSILNMMAQDMAWTQQLGNAVLVQRADLMDAVQRIRKRAYDYGYLRSNPYYTVAKVGDYIEIQPVNPQYIYIPAYDPAIVFGPPPPGFVISGAIRFGPAVILGGRVRAVGLASSAPAVGSARNHYRRNSVAFACRRIEASTSIHMSIPGCAGPGPASNTTTSTIASS